MAIVRLPCSFFTLSLQKPHNQLHNMKTHLFLYCSLSPLSYSHTNNHTLAIKTKRTSHSLLYFSTSTTTTTQDPLLNISTKTPEIQEEGEEEELSKTRLLAKNVPWTCTIEDIRALFEKHGTVQDVELSMHNKTMNRGLAFVTMGSPEEALAAFRNLDLTEFEGRTIRLSYARPKKKKSSPPVKPTPGPTFNLFLANLSFEARDKDLKEFFKSNGTDIVSAEIIYHDNPRRSSGYGFVSFKTKKEAEAALSGFQGKIFRGRPLRVARSRQFVKLPTTEGFQSKGTVADLNSSEQTDAVDTTEGEFLGQ
ncbi:RRM_1 domain-containing protein/RRM_6 domain-containing protein [Cephalotus follicularis]|uniref:RRM_1 domain-containing protein/RRM_6 domain-containing protein n=1 Tax=Cephalotus follicularis TaxID=3775 RepID=A0A1Q3CSM7_CEPFO|nr:RRM_1 domain-containing protein/RRM_6 domain-containing protein [Cephalotus follicularis]